MTPHAFSVLLLSYALAACASAPQQKPACTAAHETAKAAVEAEFFDEAYRACVGHELEDCAAYPAIREKYRPRRETAWKACR